MAGDPGEKDEATLPGDGAAVPEGGDEPVAGADDLLAKAAAEPEDEQQRIGDARKLYQARFKDLTVEEREKHAAEGDEVARRALAHDPLPRVITALMENPSFSAIEARIIAREHPSGIGLALLAGRPRLLADPEVRRRLIRNPHVTAPIIQTVLRGRPLFTIHQVSISHDVPENSKTFARQELRRAFATREPEEKVALIIKTEGRVLSLLVGVGLDGRTVSLIVGRTAMSSMLIRNFAQWPSTPPPILSHIMRLPQVQRDKSLKQALQRHPNLPSQLKGG